MYIYNFSHTYIKILVFCQNVTLSGRNVVRLYNILQYTCTTHIFNKLCKTVSADQDVYNDLLKNEKENFKVLYQKVKTFIYGLIFWPKPL